jgi:YHS domain-containing protein
VEKLINTYYFCNKDHPRLWENQDNGYLIQTETEIDVLLQL